MFKEHSATITTTVADGETMWLFRLGGLLDSPEKVREVARLEVLPKAVTGMSEMGLARFCVVGKDAQRRLEEWLTQRAVLQK